MIEDVPRQVENMAEYSLFQHQLWNAGALIKWFLETGALFQNNAVQPIPCLPRSWELKYQRTRQEMSATC